MNVLDAARRLLASRIVAEVAGFLPARPTVLLVGGALRDLLLGRTVRDLDLVVIGDAEPVARQIAARLGGHIFQLGSPPKSVWRITGDRVTIDVWESRHGLEQDILRRDFTVNALTWRLPRGPLLDPTGGLDDLDAGRLRTVRTSNLVDDPIRVLRGIRILATHPELALTASTGRQLKRHAGGLRRAPAERVRSELEILLAGGDPGRALRAGFRHEVLSALEPAWRQERPARAAAALAGRLAMVRETSRGWLRAGAIAAMPIVLAVPAAGPPRAWQPTEATASLQRLGWPRRAATSLAVAGAAAQALSNAVRRGHDASLREAAASAAELDPALSLALALSPVSRTIRVRLRRLRAWAIGFAARPHLLDGAEVATVLNLPPGPQRAAAIQKLRLAQARAEVRTRTGAIAWLERRRSLTPSSDEW